MRRSLYVCLLRMHPLQFRLRFAEDMLWIFDQEPESRSRMLADGVLSLIRQRLFRPEPVEQTAVAGAPARSLDGVPVFYTCESFTPRTSAMVNGTILSAGVFAALIFAINLGGVHRIVPAALIASYHPSDPQQMTLNGQAGVQLAGAKRPALVSPNMAGGSVSAASGMKVRELLSQMGLVLRSPFRRRIMVPVVALRPLRSKPLDPATLYFHATPVLGALDIDHDGVISSEEIAGARKALKKLDRNHDGRLSAGECGVRFGEMHLHPVLATLDADHNGVITAREIRRAAVALKKLDTNHDGRLTADEVLPPSPK
jgi:hypothetical protein